jgi:uncharacterized protein (DUF362 family)
VAIVKAGNNLEEAINNVVDHLGGMANYVHQGDTVLLKPNCVMGFDPRTGATTKPEIVQIVARMAYECGASKVMVGDNVGNREVSLECLEKAGIAAAARSAGAQVVDFDHCEYVQVPVKDHQFSATLAIAKPVLECDVLIDLPVIKTHHQTGMTAALKNLKGTVSKETMITAHRLDKVEEEIADINSVVTPHLVIVDGIIGHEGLSGGRWCDSPKPVGIVMAGTDRVAVDTVVAKLMGMDPQEIRHIQLAATRGLGCNDLDQIEILGVPLEEVATKFRTPIEDVMQRRAENVEIISDGACTGCWGKVTTVFDDFTFRSTKLYCFRQKFTIVMGKNARVTSPGIKLFIGDCVKHLAEPGSFFVPGCPVNIEQVRKTIEEIAADNADVIQVQTQVGPVCLPY